MKRLVSGSTARHVAAMVTSVGLALCAGPALAADFFVNSLAEPGTGGCTLSQCTLREAVDALSSAGDRVFFDMTAVGGSAPFTIALNSTLVLEIGGSTISGLVCTGCGTVNGTTTGAAAGLNSNLAVRVVASGSFGSGPLFSITADDVTMNGLNLDDADEDALEITGDDATVSDCFIGTSITGSVGSGNGDEGIELDDAADVVLGPGLVVSGNVGSGIYIHGSSADRPDIVGSVIGLDRGAATVLANGSHGIWVHGDDGVISMGDIGGATVALGNVISGNVGDGVRFQDQVDGGNVSLISNNVVGTNGAVTLARPNGGAGIRLLGGSDGGEEPREMEFSDNVVSGNTGAGFILNRAKLDNFYNNAVGTNAAGTLDLGNGAEGFYLLADSGKDTKEMDIGGVGLENLIAFNGGDGIRMRDTFGSGAPDVKQNTIGANAIWDNDGLGIDVEGNATGDGVALPTANSCSDNTALGNLGASRPIVTTASYQAGTLTVTGTACPSAGSNLVTVDIYLADADPTGYGEPLQYVGSVTAAQTTGVIAASLVFPGITSADFVTALQTDAAGETGEAALNVAVLTPCDGDGDGFDVTGTGCVGTDCDDDDALTFPGAPETCDGLDNDCSGSVPTDEADGDSDGESTCEGDCDDGDATAFTGAPETCDGVDDDCDLTVDEGFDTDSDGVNTCGVDGVSGNGDDDCDDGAATVFPGATELCNGDDDDCNGALPANELDGDGDGQSPCAGDCNNAVATIFLSAPELCDGLDNDCNSAVPTTEQDGDGDGQAPCEGDCNDAAATIFLSAPELCDGLDNDCNNAVPGNETDNDGDGDDECADLDCDDADATVFVGATETCDADDEDCDGSIDEGFDGDGDGFVTNSAACIAGWGAANVDCNDAVAGVNPGALELCDGFDNDCDGSIDENADLDLDGVTNCDGDCDDDDATVFPGALELCDGLDNACAGAVPSDEVDDDGDGDNECADGDCDDGNSATFVGASEVCDGLDNDCNAAVPSDETDGDGDGDNECGDLDCDDADDTTFVGAAELCDGLDNDCDGDVPGVETDDDGDGFDECAEGDCDDDDLAINPNATEVCDAVDQDCDGAIDEDFDADDDGVTTCGPDGADDTADDDCDDNEPLANPEVQELCDGFDNDCDEVVDEVEDNDADGVTNCDGDCDDLDATVFPGAPELCDGLDNDCDDAVPGDEVDDDADGFDECAGGDCDDAAATVFPGAVEVCDDGVDNDCDGVDLPCDVVPVDLDVTLGAIPPQGCACSSGGGSTPSVLLSFGLAALLLRRRRAPLLALTLAGCAPVGGGPVQTWWGTLPATGAVELEAGGGFIAGALVRALDPASVGGAELLEVVLAGDHLPATCEGQAMLFDEAVQTERLLRESLAAGVGTTELASWACQELRGAAREAFGGGGWRAVHALLAPGDGLATPAPAGTAAADLAPGTFLARVVDLDGAAGLAPQGTDSGACVARLTTRLDAGGDLPAGFFLAAALSSLDHRPPSATTLPMADGGEVEVGLVLPSGLLAAAQDDTVELTSFVGIDQADIDWPTAVVSSLAPLPTEPCADLDRAGSSIWPELAVVGGAP